MLQKLPGGFMHVSLFFCIHYHYVGRSIAVIACEGTTRLRTWLLMSKPTILGTVRLRLMLAVVANADVTLVTSKVVMGTQ